jgi:Tol biopolymer transport system component
VIARSALAVCGCLAVAGGTAGDGHGLASRHGLAATHNGLIAFTRDDHVSRIWTVLPTGEQERTLTTKPGVAEGASGWSQNGKTLVFERTYVKAGVDKVVLADPDGSSAIEVADGDNPVLSPGGRWLAFEKRYYRLFVIRRNGTGLRQLSPPGTDYTGAAWSPDGKRIAFGGDSEAPSKSGMFVIGRGGQGFRRVNSHIPLSEPAWSPDGKRLAFSFDTKLWAYLISARVDGKGSTILARFRRHHQSGDFGVVVWSPDGRWVAFDHLLQDPYAVFTVQSNGHGLKRVSRPGPQASDPELSPDGRFIVYDTFTPGRSGLEIVKAHGGFVRRIADSGSITSNPVWQPLP